MDANQDQVTSDSYSQASALTISNGVLLIAIIFLFMVIIFVFLLYLYAKKYMGTYPLFNTSPQSQFIIVTDSAGNHGLDVAVLQSLPVTVFHATDVKEGLECSVCLSEVVEGEEARILPKCSHGFHLKCIDMWFQSHSTCPLCRSAVGPDPIHTEELDHESVPIPSLDTILREGYLPEHRAIPTNVLFWGTQNEITNGAAQETSSDNSGGTGSMERETGTSGMLVIDIPRRAMENMSTVPSPMSPLPQSVMPLEDMKSPVSGRFRSLTRLLSMGKNIVGPSFSPSPRGGDIEQGFVSTPKTPKS